MKKHMIIGLLTVIIFASCNDFLDVAPPNRLTEEQIAAMLAEGDEKTLQSIFKSMADNLPGRFQFKGINSAGVLDGRYYSLQGLDWMRNLEANDVVFGYKQSASFGWLEYVFADFTTSGNDKNQYYWYAYWSNITEANKLLNYLTDALVGNNLNLKDYKARALTLRAYNYNYLMENYQDAYLQGGKDKLGLMWYDVYDPKQPNKPRLSSPQTYENIMADIDNAVRLFKEAGIGYTASTTDIDLGVANFTKARVALCIGNWDAVIEACNEILESTQYKNQLMGENVYVQKPDGSGFYKAESSGFLDISKNPEVIIGWPANQATQENGQWTNIFGTGTGGAGECFARIDNRLYEMIAADDYRKDNFLITPYGDYTYSTGVKRTIPDYVNVKFATMFGINTTDKAKWNTVCGYYMRTSEVLLMKAEAQTKKGLDTEAKTTLNVLLAARTKAGAPALTCDSYPAMAGMATLQMVQLQTKIEMWGERGLEFYNNKRWNISVDRKSSTNHVEKSEYPVNRMTLQIPKSEIDYNPLCVQN